MVQWKLKTYFCSILICLSICLLLQGSHNMVYNKCEVYTGFDYDSTFYIVTPSLNKVIYEGGHNRIIMDTIIRNNFIFIEDLITEECSHRIIVYNPDDNVLWRALNLNWGDYLDDEAWCQLIQGVNKVYTIEEIDECNEIIKIRLFNDKIYALKFELLKTL